MKHMVRTYMCICMDGWDEMRECVCERERDEMRDATYLIYVCFIPVIASLVYYLIELLGGEEGLIHILEGKENPALGYHSFPLSLILETWELGEDFMLQCKHGVLQ